MEPWDKPWASPQLLVNICKSLVAWSTREAGDGPKEFDHMVERVMQTFKNLLSLLGGCMARVGRLFP